MSAQPFPFDSLPRYRAADVAVLRAALSWLGAVSDAPSGSVLGLAIALGRVVATGPRALDSSAAMVWLISEGTRALVAVPGTEVRELARRLLSLPLEIEAPRPLTAAEQAVTALAASALLAARGSAVQVEPWQPFPDLRTALSRTERLVAQWPCVSLALTLDGRAAELCAWIPPALLVARPVARPRRPFLPALSHPALVVVATAPVPREALARLAPRDVIVVEPAATGAQLRLARGAIDLRVAPGHTQAVVESGYVRRVMDPLPDDLEVELTVTLGTLELSLRQLSELAVGQVLSLGRPLHGPFELRAGPRVIGTGELVDVDGALGVRVTSLVGS